jgi:hypothetical protein
VFRAAGIGALVAVVLIAAGVALVVGDAVPLGQASRPPERLLVIATAPDAEGVEVASFAFVLERGGNQAVLLDPWVSATIAGTTARSPREAYPFSGAQGVAEALAAQTAGADLPWLVLPSDAWAGLIDAAGGVDVTVPDGVSVYRDGRLVIVEPGRRRVNGEEMQAVAASLDYVESEDARTQVAREVNAALSSVAAVQSANVPDLVTTGSAKSSVPAESLTAFFGAEESD